MNLGTLKSISDKVEYQRIAWFRKSNFYMIRKASHIEQSIPEESDNKALYFLKQVINYMKIKEIDLLIFYN